MSKIALQGDASGTGTFTIASPNSNSNYTLNLPTATGTINTSGAVNEVPAGSASAPSIYPTGDTNTGIFFPAADTTAITTGGTERMRVDSGGNVGVGITPSAWPGQSANYDVFQFGTGAVYNVADNATEIAFNQYIDSVGTRRYITTNTALRYRIGNTEHQWFNAASGTAGNAITFTQAMTLDSSGNLLVGRTAENNTSPGFTFGLQLSGAAPIMKMVKSYSGGINALANYYSGTYVGGIDFSNTATSFPTSSDLRLKKNIAPSGSAFEKIENIRIVSHGWNHDDEVVDFGIVAQELYQVVPQAVIAGDDGEEIKKTWGVDYSKLVPVLVKAIQELKAELDTVKAELTALKGA